MAGDALTRKTAIRYRAEGTPMPNAPHCPHCGYALMLGRCPIPCGGKAAAAPERVTPEPLLVYWTPTPVR
jgi:hypothetical protein